MIAVFDVNVIVSAAIAPLGASRKIFDRFRDGYVRVAISSGMIGEVGAKLLAPRISGRYHVTPADADAFVQLLWIQADVVDVPATLIRHVTGDPEDDYVLATCVAGAADYLVTGDKELLALTSHEGVRIVNPRAFAELLEETRSSTEGGGRS